MNVLFTSIKIGSITIKNRFVRSSTHEYLASKDGEVTEKLIDVYRQLAKGGVGLINTGYTYVHPTGKSSLKQGAIYDDRFLDGWRKLVNVVHSYDAKIALQIVHGGRQTRPKFILGEPLAPSPVTDSSTGVTPKEMTVEEIEMIRDAFVDAIRRARDAGFDAVELHIAHGYLLSEFISPYTNHRTDQYGVTTENRVRIIVEILTKAREMVGRDYTIFAKLNSEDCIVGGLTIDESEKVARILAENTLDAIELSGGIAEAGAVSSRPNIDSPDKEAYFFPYAKRIKEATNLPLILVGGIRSLSVMETLINSGYVDMIAMSRPFIREPDFVNKLKSGVSHKSECISCNECFNPRGIHCSQLK